MPEANEDQITVPAPAPIAPAAPAFDPAAFQATLEAKMSERVSGLQSIFDRKIAERDETINQLKTATLSEDEREQLVDDQASEYVEGLERQLWLAQAQSQYPTAAPHLQKLFEAGGDVEAFATYLESALAASTLELAEQVSEVDPNNAAPALIDLAALTTPDGQVLTKELREQILKSFGNKSMAQIRGG